MSRQSCAHLAATTPARVSTVGFTTKHTKGTKARFARG
jgi:hypothetical protein